MKAARFGYVRPDSLASALKLLAEKGTDVRLLAGGQSLLASLAFRLSEPQMLIDISRLAELKGIARTGDTIRIGAVVTHRELGSDALVRAHAPLLAEAVPQIAHPAIRNRGTIGGSLAYADPAAELPACCVALQAQFIVASVRGERAVKAIDFFQGLFATALDADEMLTAIEIPVATAQDRSALVEIARRSGDYAMAGVAVSAAVTPGGVGQVRPVFFGLGDKPILAAGAAAALANGALTAERLAAAKAALARDLDPPADQHGSAEMKRHLAGVVLERALAVLSTNKEGRAA